MAKYSTVSKVFSLLTKPMHSSKLYSFDFSMI